MKIKLIGLSIVTSMLLIGCGSSSSSTTDAASANEILVERGPVIGSYVVDSAGSQAVNVGEGKYQFSSAPVYPITAIGGYMDVDRDGNITVNDAKLDMPLTIQTNNMKKITMLTSIAQDPLLEAALLSIYDLSLQELYEETPSTSLKISALSDVLYKYCIQNLITIEEIDLAVLGNIRAEVEQLIATNSLKTGTIAEIAAENELSLIESLNLKLTAVEASNAQNKIKQSSEIGKSISKALLDDLPLVVLTQDEKDRINYFYQIETKAKEFYLLMNEKYKNKIFEVIAGAKEQQLETIKLLMERYEIPMDAVGGVNLVATQDLYTTEYNVQGEISDNDALKAAVKIEDMAIEEFAAEIASASTPADLKVVYESVIRGLYNHSNAFGSLVK